MHSAGRVGAAVKRLNSRLHLALVVSVLGITAIGLRPQGVGAVVNA